MNKEEAYSKIMEWSDSHPDNKWNVILGEMKTLKMYAGMATIDGPDIWAKDHIEIKYEDGDV